MPGTAQDSCAETWWTHVQHSPAVCYIFTFTFMLICIGFLLIANKKVVIGAPPNSNIDPLYLFVTFNQHFSEIIFMLFKYLIR